MKKLLYLLPLLAVSCSTPTPLEVALRNSVDSESYALISYSVDTITYGMMKDSLSKDIQTLDKNLERFVQYRNNQFEESFTKVRGDKEKTEERILNGDLAYEFSDLRENTLIADSLIANWNDVKDYSYDYLKTYFYFLKRESEIVDYRRFGQNRLYDDIHDSYSYILSNEKKYRQYEEVVKHDDNELAEYKVYHHYSVIQELTKKEVEREKFVILDKDLNVVRKDDV